MATTVAAGLSLVGIVGAVFVRTPDRLVHRLLDFVTAAPRPTAQNTVQPEGAR